MRRARSARTLLGAIVALAGPHAPAGVVTTLADGGAGSLRQAITEAAAGEVITFAPELGGGTIGLSGGQLAVTRDLTIEAAGLAGGLTVSAGGRSRVLAVASGCSVAVHGLALCDGRPSAADGELGGGVFNAGTLALHGVRVSGNLIAPNGWGAGIYNAGSGTLELVDSEVSGNSLPGMSGIGAGICNAGVLVLRRSRVSDNSVADFDGAGIHNSGTLEAEDSTLAGNVIGMDGLGAGLCNVASAALVRCTVHDNRINGWGSGGGIHHSGGSLTLQNCTVAHNLGADSGGGLALDGAAALWFCTVASNSAAGGYGTGRGGGIATAAGVLTMGNCIVAGNQAAIDPDLSGLVGTVSGPNLVGGRPRLAPLGDFGGPTATMPPLPGSPAIEAAGHSAATPPTDQTGAPRPCGPRPDLGAVEARRLCAAGVLDADHDGIDDRLEPAFAALAVGRDDSGADGDGDGSPDAEEISNMTDPADAADFLRITGFAAQGEGSGFVVEFPTFPGLTYTIEADQDCGFAGPSVRVLETFTADGFTAARVVTLAAGRDFVRVRRE